MKESCPQLTGHVCGEGLVLPRVVAILLANAARMLRPSHIGPRSRSSPMLGDRDGPAPHPLLPPFPLQLQGPPLHDEQLPPHPQPPDLLERGGASNPTKAPEWEGLRIYPAVLNQVIGWMR